MEPTELSVPPALARRMEKLARGEHRTPAALLREMLRLYERLRKPQEDKPEPYDEAWAMKLMREVEAEERRSPMTPEELEREAKELRRYGAAQAKKLGIKAKDIDRLIHEHRAQRRHASRS
jgi:predicted transcriptional regulator